ncbi:hypothetical protein OH76DRAFT_772141 [Lentinus brumalis]|uniref:Uncharacterized protein n=1 Tax=Lentinus brumalis TaxID=2498619 RepID=A0A371D4U9_9APHY|nr:hypothetical protein OH76DRAFT_772141 [Polyporus brumalis]
MSALLCSLSAPSGGSVSSPSIPSFSAEASLEGRERNEAYWKINSPPTGSLRLGTRGVRREGRVGGQCDVRDTRAGSERVGRELTGGGGEATRCSGLRGTGRGSEKTKAK